MKKLLALVAVAVGATVLRKKMKDNQSEQDLWAEATNAPSKPASGA